MTARSELAPADRAGAARGPARAVALRRGPRPGALLLAVAGIHGNEPAGILAARRVCRALEDRRVEMRGELLVLAGNTRALAARVRFLDRDLNRGWRPEAVADLLGRSLDELRLAEDLEQSELARAVESARAGAHGRVYFLDLHTSSAAGPPFATIADTLANRRFARSIPVPAVLGLEEHIVGTILEYALHLGFVTFGVEAGQHASEDAVAHHEAVLWIALAAAGIIEASRPEVSSSRESLSRATRGIPRVVEIRHRHTVLPGDEFVMEPGFVNFSPMAKGQLLARDRAGAIRSREAGLVLLPLYQKQGEDGFFVGREISPAWLALSAALRRLGAPRAARVLPGVRQVARSPDELEIDTRVARFYPLDLFHLLGFRRCGTRGSRLVVRRRREQA